jgi:hypothetical protein
MTDERRPGYLALTVIGTVASLLAGLSVVILTASSGPGLDWRRGITHPGHLRLGLFTAGAVLCWILAGKGLAWVEYQAEDLYEDLREGRLLIGLWKHGPWKRRPVTGTGPFFLFIAGLALPEAFVLFGSLWLSVALLHLLQDDTWRRRIPPYGTPGPLLTVMLAAASVGLAVLTFWLMVWVHRPDEGDQQER